MMQTKEAQTVSVVRLFSKAPGNDWYYEDLHVDPEAVKAVSSLAREMGVTYEVFGPVVPDLGCYYNDQLGGLEYVQRMAARSELGVPPENERSTLPLPKVFAS